MKANAEPDGAPLRVRLVNQRGLRGLDGMLSRFLDSFLRGAERTVLVLMGMPIWVSNPAQQIIVGTATCADHMSGQATTGSRTGRRS